MLSMVKFMQRSKPNSPISYSHKKYNYLRVNVCLVCRYLPSISLWCQLATTPNQHLNVKDIDKIHLTYNFRQINK